MDSPTRRKEHASVPHCDQLTDVTRQTAVVAYRIHMSQINNNNNFINCKWVDTRWQWAFNILHMYGLFALNLVVGRGATREACSGNLEHKREPSQHLL